jgi:leucyl-tRNA synthetase
MGADTDASTPLPQPAGRRGEWNDEAVNGAWRFLQRLWRVSRRSGTRRLRRPTTRPLTHATIQRVTRDFEQFKFNTAVAALMEL